MVVPALLYLFSVNRIGAQPTPSPSIPHLERRGNVTQLIVDGKPFLALGGELYNNSATRLEYMKPIWPRLRAMNLNTVLAAISWRTLSPFISSVTIWAEWWPMLLFAAIPK
jgi:hypothetical protein